MAKKRGEGTRAPNGASSIYLGSDGKWHGRVMVGVLPDGRPDRRHVKRSTERDAIRAVRELEKQRDSGRVRGVGRAWTVEKWLTHWVESIAVQSVRPTTMVGYRASVYKHLIPGLGAHRLDKLEPEHLEHVYRQMQTEKGLKAGTAHLAHRTARVAFGEAVRRRHITNNPAKFAKPPRVIEDEIVPFTVEEAQRLFAAATNMRNGARYVIALALGLRRGEALGLRWDDLTVTWQHGCPAGTRCRKSAAVHCSARRGSGLLRIRRAVQQLVWQHGCLDSGPCGHRYGAHCPLRHSGGVVVSEVKSRSGLRTIGVPQQVLEALEPHRERQDIERQTAADLWDDGGWMFTNHVGRPVHPTVDHECWKTLLRRAGVRDARLHDARHTAATMLLVLKVPLPAVMEIMGWADAAIAKRYMHLTNEMAEAIAHDVGKLLWTKSTGTDAD